jgi:Na+/proline symporter
MKDFLLYKKANTFLYASSIAATWIWAPAIFVSSERAYFDGIWGYLMFLIPNILTLILFGYFADKVRNKVDGVTLLDVVEKADKRQKYLHLAISLTVLICSSCVQVLGIHTLFSAWFDLPKWVSAVIISLVALGTVGKNGIKTSIITDSWKWIIMFAIGLILVVCNFMNNPVPNFSGISGKSTLTLWETFGVSTAIGLMFAPYVDQTFWQRVFSLEKHKVKSIFCLSALLFGLIPFLFGMIGFFQSSINPKWSIGLAFDGGIFNGMLALCVIAALLSTLDSNLCAISSIIVKDFNQSINSGRLSMVALLTLSSILMIFSSVTITNLFLIYGTIRTCAALPTILIILDKYNSKRLFWSTLSAIIIAPIGYILTPTDKWIFTVLALTLPILGYFKNK